MTFMPFILQGSGACAAAIEAVLTTLLDHQVRRYGAASFAPRNFAAKHQQVGKT
jgi:hypothetical protein